jgi:hypothetical protein
MCKRGEKYRKWDCAEKKMQLSSAEIEKLINFGG